MIVSSLEYALFKNCVFFRSWRYTKYRFISNDEIIWLLTSKQNKGNGVSSHISDVGYSKREKDAE